VNLFIPSQLTWAEKGLSVTQDTTFPESDETTLTITASHPTPLKVLLRVPYWETKGALLKINGQSQAVDATPGSYVTLDRTWQTGDKIEFTLPMTLHLHRAADNPNMVAIMYGPLVLAGDLGRDGVPSNDNVSKNTAFFKIPDPPVPGLSGDSTDLDSWIKPVTGQPLTFTTLNAGHPDDVQLKPFYAIHHQRYSVYWQFSDSTRTTSTP
jgi:hypothetical protein